MFDDLTFALRYESVVQIAICGTQLTLPIPITQDIVDRLKDHGLWQFLEPRLGLYVEPEE
jgi:hypothetical protein